MQSRIRDLKCKEVINICDGCRLGYVDDVEVRVPEGQIVAVIVYGPCRFFGVPDCPKSNSYVHLPLRLTHASRTN